jgi:eukaryotic-like serine/threonine-protein kinase
VELPACARTLSGGRNIGCDTSAQSRLKVGDLFEGARVLATVQVLDDTEVHLVRTRDGGHAALKLFNAPEGASPLSLVRREQAFLRHLDGRTAPRALAAGNGLAPRTCCSSGVPESLRWSRRPRHGVTAEPGKRSWSSAARSRTRTLACTPPVWCTVTFIPATSSSPPNGTMTIVDFGYAVMPASGEPQTARASRGGIAFFLEPEYALAQRAGQPAPPATALGEQYAVAALLYLLLTGSHYLDFSLEPDELLRQIAEEQPLPFAERNTLPSPQLEELLLKCLSKRPEDRLPDMSAVAERLGAMRDAVPVPTGGPRNDVAPARRLLDGVLERVGFEGALVSEGLPQAPTSSLNYGAAGIAYALYRLAGVRDDPVLLALADMWVTRARAHMDDKDGCFSPELDITPETVGRSSTFHSGAGVEAVSAIVAHARGDVAARKVAIRAFLERSHLPSVSLDLTIGRCSSLLGCCLLLDTLVTADATEGDEIRRFGDRWAQEIRSEVIAFPPIGNPGEIAYMGVAHGWAGILYALLLWDDVTGRAPAPELAMRLDELALSAQPWGRGVRWPIRTGGASSYMGGWCNGSAGFVHLFTLAWRTSRNDRWLRLAEQAAWTTWEADDPVSSLCCGRSGRAYALLNLYRHTDEAAWHERARELALRAAAHAANGVEQGRIDSLYKGLLGVSLLAAEIEVPTQARMPFFEPEGRQADATPYLGRTFTGWIERQVCESAAMPYRQGSRGSCEADASGCRVWSRIRRNRRPAPSPRHPSWRRS